MISRSDEFNYKCSIVCVCKSVKFMIMILSKELISDSSYFN